MLGRCCDQQQQVIRDSKPGKFGVKTKAEILSLFIRLIRRNRSSIITSPHGKQYFVRFIIYYHNYIRLIALS